MPIVARVLHPVHTGDTVKPHPRLLACVSEIGFVGLGTIGTPMAKNLSEAGFDVRAWNRHAKPGANAGSPREAASCGLVVTMVSNDQALRDVTLGKDGVLEGLSRGGVHVVMSTVSPQTACELAALHREKGVHYVAAPVLGRPEAAAARKLWIVTAGPAEGKARAMPAFNAMGQGVLDYGEDAAAANVVKLAVNFLYAALLEALGEAFAFAEAQGVDRGKLAEDIGRTVLPAPPIVNYGRAIAAQRYEPAGFRLELGLKDVTLTLRAAESAGLELPFARMLHERYARGVELGHGHLDWAAIALQLKPGKVL